jgi:7-cyano-7-deazaguanine synthase
MTLLAVEDGIEVHPLFINYGQRAVSRELRACRVISKAHKLPSPAIIDVAGYGRSIESGLTSERKDVFLDAFLPGRNLMFLLLGAAYAYHVNAHAVAIGLLTPSTSLFPDQTAGFIQRAEHLLHKSLGRRVSVLAPLIKMTKAEAVALGRAKGLTNTYYCHEGAPQPCGRCVACREYLGMEDW